MSDALPALTSQTLLTSFNAGGSSSNINNVFTIGSATGSLAVNLANSFLNTQQYDSSGNTAGTPSTSIGVSTDAWYHVGMVTDSSTGTGSVTVVDDQGSVVDTTSVDMSTVFPGAIDMTQLTLGGSGNDVSIQHDQTWS